MTPVCKFLIQFSFLRHYFVLYWTIYPHKNVPASLFCQIWLFFSWDFQTFHAHKDWKPPHKDTWISPSKSTDAYSYWHTEHTSHAAKFDLDTCCRPFEICTHTHSFVCLFFSVKKEWVITDCCCHLQFTFLWETADLKALTS